RGLPDEAAAVTNFASSRSRWSMNDSRARSTWISRPSDLMGRQIIRITTITSKTATGINHSQLMDHPGDKRPWRDAPSLELLSFYHGLMLRFNTMNVEFYRTPSRKPLLKGSGSITSGKPSPSLSLRYSRSKPYAWRRLVRA